MDDAFENMTPEGTEELADQELDAVVLEITGIGDLQAVPTAAPTPQVSAQGAAEEIAAAPPAAPVAAEEDETAAMLARLQAL